MIAIQLSSDDRRPRLTQSHGRTLGRVIKTLFPYVVVVPIFYNNKFILKYQLNVLNGTVIN